MHQKYVTRRTEKSCSCGGTIVELFVRKMPKLTADTPIGATQKSYISSDGFSCEDCNLFYRGPKFPLTTDTQVLQSVLYEMECQPVVLNRDLTNDDCKSLFGETVCDQFLEKKAGHILYFSYNDPGNSSYSDPAKTVVIVRLMPTKESSRCFIPKSSFTFK